MGIYLVATLESTALIARPDNPERC